MRISRRHLFSLAPFAVPGLVAAESTGDALPTSSGGVAVVAPQDFGARGDGRIDDMKAIAQADHATAGGALWFPPGNYVIGGPLTIGSPVVLMPGARIRPASGVAVLLGGPVAASELQVFDRSAGGSVALALAQQAWAAWWGKDSTGLQAALAGTASGSDNLFRELWTTTGLTALVGDGQRDRNKRLLGVGGIAERGTNVTKGDALGASILLEDGANTDVIRILGDRGQCGFEIDNFVIDGNQKNQTAGNGVLVSAVKDLRIGNVVVQRCKETGWVFATRPSSNGVLIEWAQAHGCDGDGFNLAGFADSNFFTLIAGNNAGHGFVIGKANIMGNKMRAFLNGGRDVDSVGRNFKVGMIHVDHNGGEGVRITGDGAYIGHISAKKNGQDAGRPIDARVGVSFSGDCSGNFVGEIVAEDDRETSTQQFHLRVTSTGARNRVGALHVERDAGTKNIQLHGDANGVIEIGLPASQTVRYAPSVTIDPYRGSMTKVMLGGDIVFADVAADQIYDGMMLTVAATQNRRGGHSVTWGSGWRISSPVDKASNGVTIWRVVGLSGRLYEI